MDSETAKWIISCMGLAILGLAGAFWKVLGWWKKSMEREIGKRDSGYDRYIKELDDV